MSRPQRALTYRAVLSLPGALRSFTAASLGRLAYGTIGLSLLLVVHQATHSFAVAGTASGFYALGTLTGPAKSRLADRYGQRRILPVLGAGSAAAWSRWPFSTAPATGARPDTSSWPGWGPGRAERAGPRAGRHGGSAADRKPWRWPHRQRSPRTLFPIVVVIGWLVRSVGLAFPRCSAWCWPPRSVSGPST